MKLQVGKRYDVKWLDACHRWDDAPDEEIGAECHCAGWLVKQTKRGIRLAYEAGTGGIAEGTRFHMDIPAGMILEIEEL